MTIVPFHPCGLYFLYPVPLELHWKGQISWAKTFPESTDFLLGNDTIVVGRSDECATPCRAKSTSCSFTLLTDELLCLVVEVLKKKHLIQVLSLSLDQDMRQGQ